MIEEVNFLHRYGKTKKCRKTSSHTKFDDVMKK